MADFTLKTESPPNHSSNIKSKNREKKVAAARFALQGIQQSTKEMKEIYSQNSKKRALEQLGLMLEEKIKNPRLPESEKKDVRERLEKVQNLLMEQLCSLTGV